MATSLNNIEDAPKSSSASTSSTHIHRGDANWWIKHLQKEDKNNDNYIITNLVAELAILLNDKIKLEGENSLLQIENEAYKKKLNEIELKLKDDDANASLKIKGLEESIRQQENNSKLVEIDHYQEVKNYLSEINLLKEQYYGIKDVSDKNTNEFKKIIGDLERELQLINIDNSELLREIRTYKDKIYKYKDKLKSSNAMVAKFQKMISTLLDKNVVNKSIQTDDLDNLHMEPIQDPFEHEKILSELFFKENPSDFIDSVFLQSSILDNRY